VVQDRQLLTDIRIDLTSLHPLRPLYAVGVDQSLVKGTTVRDFGLISGRGNLGQAILMRLMTPVGELAPLGHPDYGSRLNEIVGRQNTDTNRNLAKLFILDSLRQEPRIKSVVSVTATPSPLSVFLIDIELVVQPVGDAAVVQVGPFTLELQS
jgi:hypothetical protein